jgi:hypothetical protein
MPSRHGNDQGSAPAWHGDSGQGAARARRAARRAARPESGLAEARAGGYEGLALRVIDGLPFRPGALPRDSARRPASGLSH